MFSSENWICFQLFHSKSLHMESYYWLKRHCLLLTQVKANICRYKNYAMWHSVQSVVFYIWKQFTYWTPGSVHYLEHRCIDQSRVFVVFSIGLLLFVPILFSPNGGQWLTIPEYCQNTVLLFLVLRSQCFLSRFFIF